MGGVPPLRTKSDEELLAARVRLFDFASSGSGRLRMAVRCDHSPPTKAVATDDDDLIPPRPLVALNRRIWCGVEMGAAAWALTLRG